MVNKVEILTGGTCNLKCNYCFLCKIKALHGLDEDVVNGLESGSYLENVKEVFKRTHNNPLLIEEMTCWGGEPTIHLPLLTDKLKDWFKFFPNITRLYFATNGTFFSKRNDRAFKEFRSK